MPTIDDRNAAVCPFDIVGRVRPETAGEMLDGASWRLYALVRDPVTGRLVTLIRHTSHPHVMIVEEPEQLPVDTVERVIEDPGEPPGPWPDA